ncbi:maleylpyruvate isomerase family mycothiol-dependent enzyme [Nakamurella leprariae]|uniref:Maleylpyruvate isomerase family mycothiol-dependent enzyme n=1 Tax=Nakamurella leprariae TaxID=2803911 RepID=A0A938YH86_9ACTN|nr:maleylpyruvate isomerase family mycothiol-dependent enzyme [Nakamurella leprariae]MBM9467765.1 maleylpyruvate isomerase family mycothiol-dependent enzyme [Nakamurella leprariae]
MPARTDQVTDPALAARLLTARRGQAYWSRQLSRLSDDDLDAPSMLPGWTRRHVIAHVGLNARAITHLTAWAATGVEHPMYDSPTQRGDDIALASTLPPQALRNLSDHAAIHLSVEWRDLSAAAWTNEVRTAQGRTVPVSETVWMRSREVWIHAVDLGNGGSFLDFPPEFVDDLLVDITGAWSRRRHTEGLPDFAFQPTDRAASWRSGDSSSGATVLVGPAARLAQWASGRGTVGVHTADGTPVPPAPRWL